MSDFNSDITIWTKLGDFLIAACVGIGGWFIHKFRSTDNRLAAIELDLAKNYVTNSEFVKLSEKLDHNMEMFTSKLDTVNENILLLVKERIK